MFLRKNMDSQGYVPLSVIASFKRIKALTEDIDLLRNVCNQIKSIEFLPGEDGDDRLRRREGWENFTLPLEDRLPLAQNDGPPAQSRQYRKAANNGYPKFTDPSFSTAGQMRSPS